MSRNNTGNPIDSKAFPDFEDNVKNLDQAVNSDELEWVDRLGQPRRTLAGVDVAVARVEAAATVAIEQDIPEIIADTDAEANAILDTKESEWDGRFQAAQDLREQQFRTFIASSGYQFAGDYAAGIEITQYNQLVRDSNGEFWRVSGQVDLPYVTTGAGVPEGDALVPAGDAVLRQDIHKGMSIAGPWAVDGSAMREPLSSSSGISLGSEKARPMVTFIDDDGRSVLLSTLRPLYDAKGVKPGFALPTGKIGVNAGYMTWEDVRDLYDNGWEVMSHNVTEANLSQIPEAQWEEELRDSRLDVESRGMKIESFVPPFGEVPAASYPLIRKYYRSSYVTMENGIQPVPISNYLVRRKNAVNTTADANPSLQELKDSVDLAIASNSWLVLTTHSAYPGLDETQIGVISDLIDYIRSQGVEIVTPSEGMDVHGNLVDTGHDRDGLNPDTYFKIDRNGESWPLKTKFAMGGPISGLGSTSLLTDFEDNCITILRLAGDLDGLPPGLGARRYGLLKTVKHTIANVTQGFQEFFPPGPGTQCFVRAWGGSASGWQPWVETSNRDDNDIYGIFTSIDGDSPITDFSSDRKTIIRTSAGEGGWPNIDIFTVETTHLRATSSESYGYQTAISRTSGLTYIRSWDRASSQWFEWERIGASASNVMQGGTFNASEPVQSYPENRLVGNVSSSVTPGMPSGSSVGIVTTLYREALGSTFGHQTFIATDANRSYVRTWDRNASQWSEWEEVGVEASKTMQGGSFDASAPVQSYPENRLVGHASTTGTSGMPTGSGAIGIVTTLYREVAGSILGYQTFIATDVNRSYVRTWDRSGVVWRDWVETSPQAT